MMEAKEAEAAVLALCLRQPESHRRATLELEDDHFHDPALKSIWRAAKKLTPPLDLQLLTEAIRNNGGLEHVGGKARLAALKFTTAEPDNLNEYIRALHAARAHRRLEMMLARASEYVRSTRDPIDAISAQVSDMLTEAAKANTTTNDGPTLHDALTSAFQQSYEAMQAGTGLTGIRTNVPAIDEMIGGFELGHVTTLMGEAATGKTGLALQAAVGASQYEPVGFISLEMPPADLAQRIQASVARVNYAYIRRGQIETIEDRLASISEELANTRRLWFAPDTVETWDQSVAWITHMYYTHGCRIFILDNVLSLDYAGKDEYEHVTRVASGSQRLVKKLNISLLNLHHTNSDERPTLRKAHSAKAITRHSSNVLALWRENPESNDMYLMELKGRNHGRSERMIRFIAHQQRFTEVMP